MEMTYRDQCDITKIHLTSFEKGHVRVVLVDIPRPAYAEKMKVECIAVVEIQVNHFASPYRNDISESVWYYQNTFGKL